MLNEVEEKVRVHTAQKQLKKEMDAKSEDEDHEDHSDHSHELDPSEKLRLARVKRAQ